MYMLHRLIIDSTSICNNGVHNVTWRVQKKVCEWERRGVEEGDVGGKEESGGRSVWERRVEKKVCEWERRRVEEGVCG